MDEKEMFMNMMFGLADFMHERSPIFKKYKKARRIHQDVINSMMDYVDKNDLEPSSVLMTLRRDLRLNLNNQLDNHIFGDLLVYPHIPEFECVTKQYLDRHRFRAVDKVKMLDSMMNSYYSVFNIVARNEEDGIVTLYDVFRNETIEIVDSKLGMTYKGNNYFLLRIIEFDEIKFQTGLTMVFDQDKRNTKMIKSAAKNYKTRYTNTLLDLFYYQRENQSKITIKASPLFKR